MMMDGIGMMIWGVFSFVLALVLIFVLILAVLVGAKWLWGQKTPAGLLSGESALDILKKRYARGEIDKEEFERIRKEIE
ncbi:MAG: SHOCT domain-containing protein [Deltaproteobacteria bacterium]|nr:SHOCT domain-containing protein [Deltaproteobacteria bacterium]